MNDTVEKSDPLVSRMELPEHAVKFSDSKLFTLIRAGDFPAPIRLGAKGRTRYWRLSDIRTWIARQTASVSPVPA